MSSSGYAFCTVYYTKAFDNIRPTDKEIYLHTAVCYTANDRFKLLD